MDLYSCIGFAAVAALMSFTVRRFDQQAGAHIALAAAALILFSIAAALTGVLDDLNALAAAGGFESGTFTVILKAFGLAYLSEFTASLCRDLGENSLAVSAELVGRVLLVLLALPIIRNIADVVISLITETL